MRGFSVIGCIVGIVVGVLVYAFLTAVLEVRHEDLIAGAVAVLIWLALTFRWPGDPVA
jgi:hypothetical protein